MAREMVDLRNTATAPAKIWVPIDGKEGEFEEVVLPPLSSFPFSEDIARKFLTEYPGTVLEDTLAEIPDRPGQERVWVANMTGNPFLPETILVPSQKENEPPLRVPHPNGAPMTLHWRFKADEIVVKDSDANYCLRFPGPSLSLPPYERVSMPASDAATILQRDGMQQTERQGKVMYARAPQVFEANRTWQLDDMIIYAKMVDEVFFNPRTLAEKFPSEEKLEGNHKAIRETKMKLWQHLFFRIVDPHYGLPPKEAFLAAKRQAQAAMSRQPAAPKQGRPAA